MDCEKKAWTICQRQGEQGYRQHMEMDEKRDLKGCTKVLICSAQEESKRTNYIKYNIDKTAESPLCRICGTRNETISHIVSECGKPAQKEYKRKHDSVGRYVHWQFCQDSIGQGFDRKLGYNRARIWYEHEAESVVENENFKILWDFTIQCDDMTEARRPYILVVDKLKKETMIIDEAIPGNTRVCDKGREKIKKHSLLKDEVASLWQMKKAVVIPIAVGVLGTITPKFEKYIESFEIEIRIEHIQKSALLGIARIIKK